MTDNSSNSEFLIKLTAIMDAANDAIICIDRFGIIDLVNPAAEKIFGYTKDEMVSKNVSMLMPEPYASQHDSFLERYHITGEKRIIGIGKEIIAKRKNGEVFPIELTISENKLNGEPVYAGFVRDLQRKTTNQLQAEQFQDHLKSLLEVRAKELAEANKKLERLAKVDELTGIANRRYFNEVLENEIRRAVRNNTSISLLLCDVDHFKLYNDNYGHVKGDECLQKIGECFKQSFKRADDLPARYGGEEFAAILAGSGLEEAKGMAKNLTRQIELLDILHEYSLVSDHITLSIGIVSVQPDKNYSDKTLIKAADQALYNAKEKGRNRIEIYQQ